MTLRVEQSWAQLRHEMPPRRTKLRTLSPTCVQTCPRCAMLDPSWAKLEPTTGPSSGQVRPKFGPSGLLFSPTHGQGRPSLTPVGFDWAKYARSLSIHIHSLGAGGSRREATRIILSQSKSTVKSKLISSKSVQIRIN